MEVLCTRSNREIHLIKEAYKKVYGKTLEKAISGDTSGYFERLLISLCTANRDENPNVDMTTVSHPDEEVYCPRQVSLNLSWDGTKVVSRCLPLVLGISRPKPFVYTSLAETWLLDLLEKGETMK